MTPIHWLDSSNSNEITAFWKEVTEVGIESGQQSVLGFGIGAVSPAGVAALSALGRLSRTGGTLSAPLLVAGSEGALWMLVALQARLARGVAADQATTVTFGGADAVTFAASLNLLKANAKSTESRQPPLGLIWLLSNSTQPGSQPSDVEDLPFHLAGDAFLPVATPAPQPRIGERLEPWLGLLLVLALVAATLLL